MKDKRGKYRKKEGFTLVELICVIAIMGILMAIAVPSYSHLQERSAKQVAISNARSNYVQGKAQQEMLDAGILTEKETERPKAAFMALIAIMPTRWARFVWVWVVHGHYRTSSKPTIKP